MAWRQAGAPGAVVVPAWFGAGDATAPGVGADADGCAPDSVVGTPSFAAIADVVDATTRNAQSMCLKDMRNPMNDEGPNDPRIASIRCKAAGRGKALTATNEALFSASMAAGTVLARRWRPGATSPRRGR